MGKTHKKLTIVVLPPCDKWPEIEVLEGQGHTIIKITDPKSVIALGESTSICAETISSLFLEADLILGPNCWLMDTTHKRYLSLALKSSRLKRYGPASARKKKGVKSNEDDDFDKLSPSTDSSTK